MVIVRVEVPAGPTIEEAIRECLDFSERCGCMVRVYLNDIHMLIVNSSVFGKTLPDRIQHYRREYLSRLEQEKRYAKTGKSGDH